MSIIPLCCIIVVVGEEEVPVTYVYTCIYMYKLSVALHLDLFYNDTLFNSLSTQETCIEIQQYFIGTDHQKH